MWYLIALAHGVVLFTRQASNSPGLVAAELSDVGGVFGGHLANE